MGGRRRAYATPANAYPAGSLAGAPVRGCGSTSENLVLPSVWTCQNPTFHLVSKKLARADGVVVSHDRTKVVWCCVTKAQKSTTMAAALSFPNSTPARARLVLEQVSMKSAFASQCWLPGRLPLKRAMRAGAALPTRTRLISLQQLRPLEPRRKPEPLPYPAAAGTHGPVPCATRFAQQIGYRPCNL